MKSKILIVEDDEDVLTLLQGTFEKTGDFEVLTATEGATAVRQARLELPDALLLDLMLPGMTGLEVCRVLKASPATSNIPILVVTAKADEFDRINGFELGVDDYIVKPFSPREVLLRTRAVMRRTRATPVTAPTLEAGPISIDRVRCLISLHGKAVRLTSTEFKLLVALAESQGRVLQRERLLNDVWGYESIPNTRTVDTHIRRLRDKLGPVGSLIQTIRGFGYRMKESS